MASDIEIAYKQIEESLRLLQSRLSIRDALSGGHQATSDDTPFAIARKGMVVLDMRSEYISHKLPHFHICYKNAYEASYRIDTLERLVGEMPRKYEQDILPWATENKSYLMKVWDGIIFEGVHPRTIVIE